MNYDATFKIVLFGDSGVPKTTLTQRLLTNLFISDTKMTIGVDFEIKSLVVDENKVKLQIWDFGGEKRFRFLLPTYLRNARGAMFVYDITNYLSLAHIDDWLTVIRKEIKPEDRFPILVVGVNADLSQYREVPAEDAIKIAKSRGVDGFIECSAKTGENVAEAFEALTRLMLDYSEPRELGVKPDITDKIGLKQVKDRLIDDIEIKIKRILELEKEEKRKQSLSREEYKDKTPIGSFMNQNLKQWLETLKGLKKACEEIIKLLSDKNDQFYHHYSFEHWEYFLNLSSELLEEFKGNSSFFYNMSEDTKIKLYILFEIFKPCREILGNSSFGKSVKVTLDEYLKMLKRKRKIQRSKIFGKIKVPENSDYDILLVDDNSPTIRLLTTYFDSRNVTCRGFVSGKKALEELENQRPKIILLDIILPDINGSDICKKIKSTPNLNDIPVLFIPSIPFSEVEKHLAETKADGYILKPFNLSDFDGILELLGSKPVKDHSI